MGPFSVSRCKMIGFISSQTLPQVTLGMLEIMKYKIPLFHITYFPHHYLYYRFTIMLTSKLRKLFLYSIIKGSFAITWTTIQCLFYIWQFAAGSAIPA